MSSHNLPLLGAITHVDIPEFGLKNIQARVDTGALGGALHAKVHGIIEKEGKKLLLFSVIDSEHPENLERICEVATFRQKRVKSAHGDVQTRYKIPVTLHVAGKMISTEIGLTNRKNMRFPMLLGRAALAGNFLVDVSK